MEQGAVTSSAASDQNGLRRHELIFPRLQDDLRRFLEPLVDEILFSSVRMSQLVDPAPGHGRRLDSEEATQHIGVAGEFRRGRDFPIGEFGIGRNKINTGIAVELSDLTKQALFQLASQPAQLNGVELDGVSLEYLDQLLYELLLVGHHLQMAERTRRGNVRTDETIYLPIGRWGIDGGEIAGLVEAPGPVLVGRAIDEKQALSVAQMLFDRPSAEPAGGQDERPQRCQDTIRSELGREACAGRSSTAICCVGRVSRCSP